MNFNEFKNVDLNFFKALIYAVFGQAISHLLFAFKAEKKTEPTKVART